MTSQPPGESQGKTMLIIHLLASCLSYSNSAMNPVLYAFLSDNFKKSFLKVSPLRFAMFITGTDKCILCQACSCHTGRDINAQLHVENSVFPRKNGASTKSQATAR